MDRGQQSHLPARPLHGVRLLQDGIDDPVKGGDTTMALRVWRQDQPPKPAGAPIWHKADRGDRYQSLLSLYRTENGLELKVECEGRGVFEYTPNGVGIAWEYGGTGPAHYFQTLGLSLWLELQGVPCIHANALALA
ncbi:MAG TPA: hypothetical protein ENI90_08060, partial [Methylothermaceae bacterium]|nr:hypothetical protein [Methylothermaceae bacterium]